MFLTCSYAHLAFSNNYVGIFLISYSNKAIAIVFLASLKYLFKPAFECLDYLLKYIWPLLVLFHRRVLMHKEVRAVAWSLVSDISISNAPLVQSQVRHLFT